MSAISSERMWFHNRRNRMDNFRADITSHGTESFKIAMNLLEHNKVVGYREDGNNLILYWAESPKMTKLPFPMTISQASDFVLGWLEHANYGEEPDHDGHNRHGWRIFNESWGHIGGEWQAFVVIEPVWAEFGK
jgi:hypothetical protein